MKHPVECNMTIFGSLKNRQNHEISQGKIISLKTDFQILSSFFAYSLMVECRITECFEGPENVISFQNISYNLLIKFSLEIDFQILSSIFAYTIMQKGRISEYFECPENPICLQNISYNFLLQTFRFFVENLEECFNILMLYSL